MPNWPLNAEALQGIARGSFYRSLQSMEGRLVYPHVCEMVDQQDLTVTYTSFGGVPEPRQLSGTVASSGQRQAKGVLDYALAVTVVEWEQTVVRPRSVVETNPDEIARVTSEMAIKAQLYMDRYLIGTVLPSTTKLGYDGIALYNASHAESGSNQDNDLTAAAATGTKPTAAELETNLDTELATLKEFQDDQGTPVNAGVSQFAVVVPTEFEYLYKSVLEPLKGQVGNYDSSSGSGRFRGMFNVYGSPFVATADRHYTFAMGDGVRKAVACFKNKDFEFVTNIGTDSDAWRLGQKAIFSSYARFEFMPWNWKSTTRFVWT